MIFYETQTEMLLSNLGHQNVSYPTIGKEIRTMRKGLYVIFSDNKGQVVQIPVPKVDWLAENVH